MRKLLAFLTVCLCLSGCRTAGTEAASDVKFFGADSRRATLSFETDVLFQLPEGWQGDDQAIYESDQKEAIDEVIALQLQHMFSAFVNHSKPFDFTTNPGIPRDRPQWTVLSTKQVSGQRKVKVHYSYTDVTVFRKDLFTGGQVLQLPFLLPKDPVEIYSKGIMPISQAKQLYTSNSAFDQQAREDIEHAEQEQLDVKPSQRIINTCTDLHYWSEGDYWYFWNPHQKGCKQATRDATIQVTGTFKPMNSTTNTYPRYDTLYGDNGNGDEVRITFLVGIDENWSKGDLGRIGFEKDFRMLTEGKDLLAEVTGNQDTDVLLTPEAKMIKASPDFRMEVVKNEARHRTLRFKQDGHNVLLNMYLVDPNSDLFVEQAKKGLKEADFFLYDGHSGLGGYLSVGRLFGSRKEPLKKDKYQIYMFNGCSTFSYYNYDYFQLKALPDDPEGKEGFRGLDIVTSATPAAFSSGPGTDYWMIRALASGERQSWQQIMKDVMKIAGEESALLHVNGDEDNPGSPGE